MDTVKTSLRTLFPKWLLIMSILFGLCGCLPKIQSSKLRLAPLDRNAKNYALLIGAPNDLPGVSRDIQNMRQALGEFAFNYTIHSVPQANRDQILESLTTAASRVGDKGTLLVYLSGHGTPAGAFVAQGAKTSDPKKISYSETVEFSEIIAAIERGRISEGKVRPIAYLQIIGDFCFSGHWTSGDLRSGSEVHSTGNLGDTHSSAQLTSVLGGSNTDREVLPNSSSNHSPPPPFEPDMQVASLEQLHNYIMNGRKSILERAMISATSMPFIRNYLLVGSSSVHQTSIDQGNVFGGLFTGTFLIQIHELRSRMNDPTLKDLLDITAQKIQEKQQLSYTVSDPRLLDIRLLTDQRPDVPVDPTPEPPMGSVFSFDLKFNSHQDPDNLYVKNIKNCDSATIKWEVRLPSGKPCTLKTGSCQFVQPKPFSDFTINRPEDESSFMVYATCGSKQLSRRVQIDMKNMDLDKDGVDDQIDLCLQTPPGAVVLKSGPRIGCREGELSDLEDRDHDGVKNNEDICPNTPNGRSVAQSGSRKGCAAGDKTRDEINSEVLPP